MIKILLVGCGYHARRIYVPYLQNHPKAQIAAIVDILPQKELIEQYLEGKSMAHIARYYTSQTKPSRTLLKEEIEQLDALVIKENIDTVIIATEPLSHFKYADWALNKGLHILMDKPISTETDVSTHPKKARRIYEDFADLKKTYESALKKKNTVFILQAQRRFHKGFQRTRDLIEEIARKTNCPVTSITALHSDGQWRFPREILEQSYHPYNQGYGKMSHSGYHALDMAIWFSKASILEDTKEYDNFELFSQAVRPIDFVSQLLPEDYKKLFPSINANNVYSSVEFKKMMQHKEYKSATGEIDAHTLIALRHGKRVITNIGLHAIHNGFSQRNWMTTEGKDLYKGNGRVRHESYTIEQGPFQCIIINSFQSEEMAKSTLKPNELGGEFHYDIHVFRNSTLFPEFKPYSLTTIADLDTVNTSDNSRGHQENARRNCIENFITCIENDSPPKSQISNFLEHNLSTQLLGAIYSSIAASSGKRITQQTIH